MAASPCHVAFPPPVLPVQPLWACLGGERRYAARTRRDRGAEDGGGALPLRRRKRQGVRLQWPRTVELSARRRRAPTQHRAAASPRAACAARRLAARGLGLLRAARQKEWPRRHLHRARRNRARAV